MFMKRKRRQKMGMSTALFLLLGGAKLNLAVAENRHGDNQRQHHTSNFHSDKIEITPVTNLRWHTKQANGQSYGGMELHCDPKSRREGCPTEPMWLSMKEDIVGISSATFQDSPQESMIIHRAKIPVGNEEELKKFMIDKFREYNPEEAIEEKKRNDAMKAKDIFSKALSTSEFVTEAPTAFKFGLNYGSTPEQIHFWHRMQQAFFLTYGKKKIGSRNKDDMALWQQFYKSIINYGCYCYIGRPVTGGRGNAVDGLDEVCKALFRCERCLAIDSGNGIFGETGCDRHMGYTYRAKVDKSKKPYIFCHTNNNKCQMASCRCDKAWAQAVAELYEFWSEDNKFIFDENGYCEKQERPDGSEKGSADRCCGYYPTREPYKSYSHRQCCGIQMYNSNNRDCCDPKESKLAKSGQCNKPKKGKNYHSLN